MAALCRQTTLGALSDTQFGTGAGVTEGIATLSALGEAVERYCGMFGLPSLKAGIWSDFCRAGHIPEVAALNQMHCPRAPGFSQVTLDGKMRCAKGYLAHSPGTLSYIPWSLVCLGCTPLHRERWEVSFPGPCVSTGLACGTSSEQAALKALLECCERDAIMLAWYSRSFSYSLTHAALHRLSPVLMEELARCRLEAHVVDVTVPDLRVPVFVSVVTQPSGSRGAFGMGCALSPEWAAVRALIESIHAWIWTDTLRRTNPPASSDMSTFEGRVLAYGSGLMRRELSEFLRHVEVAPILDAPRSSLPGWVSDLRSLADHLAENGHSSSLFDVTTPDIREAGLSVMRAVVPSLQVMESNHEWRIPNTVRISTLGFRRDFVDVPHPYP